MKGNIAPKTTKQRIVFTLIGVLLMAPVMRGFWEPEKIHYV